MSSSAPAVGGALRALASPGLSLVYASVFWGANAVVARAVIHDIDPFSLTFWRWLLAVIVLLPFVWTYLRKDWPEIVRNAGLITLLGLSSVTAYTITFYVASQTTPAINLSLIGSTIPAFSIAAAWIWLGERVTPTQGAGFAVGFLGVVVVICRGDVSVLAEFRIATGDIVLMVGVITWAAYSILLKIRDLKIHRMSLLCGVFITGFVGTIPFFAWEVAVNDSAVRINLPALLSIVYGALFMSIGAYFCFMRGVAALGANKANAYGYLAPMFAAVFAVGFLGEEFALYHVLSFALIVVGVYLATATRATPAAIR